MRGNTVDAVHDPTVRACIIPETLLDTLVGDVPLIPTDGLFHSPRWRCAFPYKGITRDVPITIDDIEVRLDFHVYDIVDSDLLLGFPLENPLAKSQGNPEEEELRETVSVHAESSKHPLT